MKNAKFWTIVVSAIAALLQTIIEAWPKKEQPSVPAVSEKDEKVSEKK